VYNLNLVLDIAKHLFFVAFVGGRSFVKVSLSLKQDRNDTYECIHVG
jgi:hypothetical protein